MPNDSIRAAGPDRAAAPDDLRASTAVADFAIDDAPAVVADVFAALDTDVIAAAEADVFASIEADTHAAAAAGFIDLAAAHFARTGAEQGRVSPAEASPALAARFDEPMPREGRPLADVVARLAADVVPNAIALHHPMYMGHQVSAPLPAAVWSEALVGALNQSMPVAEMSPAMTAIEHRVVRWMCDLAGFDGPRAGGTFTSGGTEATFAALLAARSALMPDVWRDGVAAAGVPPVILCGEHAHYAVARAVGEMGLGLRSVQLVPSREYRMDVGALAARVAALVAEGTPILAVVATAGSTATGSFDDFTAIADVCEEHRLWLHVDGAHGASALLSERDRERLRGIGRARSLAWDPHKMMLLPLSAGVVLVRDERDLEAAFTQAAPYLFHSTETHGTDTERGWDTGVRSFQCSRRADALKAWVALQRYGGAGIGRVYDRLCDTTRALHALVEAHPDFVALHAPESNILCFRWTGGDSSGTSSSGSDDAFVDAVNRETRERYNRTGAGWITATLLGGRRVLRVTVMNPRTTPEHAGRLVNGLLATAREVAATLRP